MIAHNISFGGDHHNSLLLPDEMYHYSEGDRMTAGTAFERKEENGLQKPNHSKRSQRIIAILFLMALLSLGAFILLRLLLEQAP